MVLLLPGFGGGEGAYVVPWRVVPELGPMSVHDRALHENIFENRAVTPILMRHCVLRIAATGLAGPTAAEAARVAMELEEKKTLETHFLIIVSLLLAVGVDIADLVGADPSTGGWRGKARTLLNGAGGRLGFDPGQFYARSAALARIVAPVGLANAPSGSRYRKLMKELDLFRESSVGWGTAERSEIGVSAIAAGEVAGRTSAIVTRVLGSSTSGPAIPGGCCATGSVRRRSPPPFPTACPGCSTAGTISPPCGSRRSARTSPRSVIQWRRSCRPCRSFREARPARTKLGRHRCRPRPDGCAVAAIST